MSAAVAGSTRGRPVAATVAVLFTALVLVPVLWGISTSFKNEVDAVQVPPQLLPAPATASNYMQVLSNPNFLNQLGNSVLYSVGSVLLALYRKSLLEQAHVTPPRNWDELCADGPRFTQRGIIPFAVPIGGTGGLGRAQAFGEYFLSSMLPGDQGGYFKPDGSIAFSRESFIRAATTIKDLFTRCKVTPAQSLQLGVNEVHDGLRAGKIAMTIYGLYRFRTIQNQGAGEDLAWAPPPTETPDSKLTVYGYQLALNTFSNKQDAGWRFLRFMISPEAQVIAAEGGEVVSRASAYSAEYFNSPAAADQKQWAALIRSRGREVQYTPILTTFHQIIGDAFQRMILANGTPETAYDEVVKAYNAALAKSR